MAEKKVTIVIKKVDGGGAGAHGGAWKVAFADFMTAMMAFFLVMWLLAQAPEVKSEVASYFSGPSMLEHDFTSYGAELTLEKLFLDLVNEPLKTAQQFMEPADFTPNLMAMGSRKVVLQFVANELGGVAKNVTVDGDSLVFEIPDRYLFQYGTSNPSVQFVDIMTKIKKVTTGLEDSIVSVDVQMFDRSVPEGDVEYARRVGFSRRDLVQTNIRAAFEHSTNDMRGGVKVELARGSVNPEGTVKITIEQKDTLSNGKKPRPLEDMFTKERDQKEDVYDDFVKRVSEGKKKPSRSK